MKTEKKAPVWVPNEAMSAALEALKASAETLLVCVCVCVCVCVSVHVHVYTHVRARVH